ncbi:hypothetical protein [Pseudomonas fulva]|uniref:hypothetical protein n=1 Tax=Pseudomonas TaxID=286 RepID=UPI002DB5BB61|nr:hypothetical protein [Pseudomonas fulva]MEC4021807.1 hypothetical protein [Pseudomonas fulva]
MFPLNRMVLADYASLSLLLLAKAAGRERVSQPYSRGWFLHALLNSHYLGVSLSAGREPWGSYFNERMMFFGEADRRDLALRVEPDGESAPAALIADTSGHTRTIPADDAEQWVQHQQRITAVWDAHYAKVKETNNGLG